MGRVEISATESIEISLICNAYEQKFLVVRLKTAWDIEDYIPRPMNNVSIIENVSQKSVEPLKLKRDDQSSQIQVIPFES